MINLFFKRLAVFVFSFLFLLKLPGYFDIYAVNDQSRDLNSIACSRKSDGPDLLFLGSSYTYSTLNPIFFDSMGLKSFNLGISGSGIYFTELILDDFYNSAKNKPKYIIVDISHFAFCDKSDDFLSYPIHRYLGKPISHEALLLKYPAYTSFYLQFLAKSSKKGLSSFVKKHQNVIDSTCYYRGFFPDYTIIDKKIEQIDSTKLKFLKNARIDKEKFACFLNMVEKYSQKGCKIFWFEAPTQKLKYFFDEAYRIEYEKLLAIIRSNEKLKEIDLKDVKLVRDDFRNTDHLNSYGAKKISASVSAKLKLYLLENK